MRVLHVICSLSRASGGPARSSQGLVAGLCASGIDAWLMALCPGEEPWIKGVDHFINGGDFDAALNQVKPDIVHLHGIWSLALHRCAVLCRKRKIPYVISPRGMLEPWSLQQKRLKKRIARFLYQDRDLKRAAALHATADSEAAQFRNLGFKNDIIVSPNGVNVPDTLPESNNQTSKQSNNPHRALFVSRMHPKKGVLELVESWARVKPRGWQCELVYTLNGETERAYEAEVKARVESLGLTWSLTFESNNQTIKQSNNSSPDFIFTGPLSDDAKWQAYARADLFVLPTYSENFGIVVAEALYAGLPVITTKGTPWSDLIGINKSNNQTIKQSNNSLRSGWWIDLPKSGETIWTALDEALCEATSSEPSVLESLGRNGRELVERKYIWSAVVKPFLHGYEQVLNPCEMAPCDRCVNYGDVCPIK